MQVKRAVACCIRNCGKMFAKVENSRSFLLLAVGVIAGILLNQCGLVLEHIRVRVNVESENKNPAEEATLQDLLYRLPHLKNDRLSAPYLVPNIVHYFWFTTEGTNMTLVEYLSIVSAYRVQKPDAIWFHCNRLPHFDDKWWVHLWHHVPIHIIHEDLSELTASGQPSADSMRWLRELAIIRALLQHGGIYLDWNVLMINNVDQLRNYSTFLCKDRDDLMGTDIILSNPSSLFMQHVETSFLTQQTDLGHIAANVYKQFPDLLRTDAAKSSVCSDPVIGTVSSWKSRTLYRVSRDRQNVDDLTLLSTNSEFGLVASFINNKQDIV